MKVIDRLIDWYEVAPDWLGALGLIVVVLSGMAVLGTVEGAVIAALVGGV
jgi:hypothetical protein